MVLLIRAGTRDPAAATPALRRPMPTPCVSAILTAPTTVRPANSRGMPDVLGLDSLQLLLLVLAVGLIAVLTLLGLWAIWQGARGRL